MSDLPDGRVTQKVRGRDVYVAGGTQTINNYGAMSAGGTAAVPGMLPRDISVFTGRVGELERLAGLAGGGQVVVTAIGGTAGVGKTALAVHAAHRLLEKFPDGHLYADLRGYTAGQEPAEPGEVLGMFLRRLGVAAEEIPAGMEERSGVLRGLLASRQMLMLLDNAASEAQVRPLLPGAGGSLVLLTSRSVLAALDADTRISLDVLPEQEAADLLAGLIGDVRANAEPEAAARVLEWCGGLPLALRIAGQILAVHPAWPMARLERLLAAERDRLGSLAVGDAEVRAAFEVSYRHLPEADAQLFRLLGLHPGPGFGAGAAAALAGIGPETAERGLGRLAEAYLVTEDGADRFGMHDLLRLYAWEACEEADDRETRDAAETRLARWYAYLAMVAVSCLDPRLRMQAVQRAEQAGVTLPSPREALGIIETERANLLAAAALAARHGHDELVLELSGCVADAMALLRYLDDLLTLSEAALATARRAGDAAAEAGALNNLGEAYRQLRRFEDAIGCYQQALVIVRETRGRDTEGQTLNNLGIAYGELGRFDEAVGCYQQALAIRLEIGDRHGEGQTLTNLSIAYRYLGRFENAIACLEQALTISQAIGDRYGESRALGNLGTAYGVTGRFEDAIDCTEQTLAICREIRDRHGEGQSLNNLGSAYTELGRFEEAISWYEQSLAVRREDRDRHGEGETLYGLGCVYREIGQPDRAAGYWRDAAAAMRDADDDQEVARLEQMASAAASQKRRRRRR